MKKEIHTSIRINATAEIVWSVFTHFEEYPRWNTFIKSLTGDVKVGNKIKVVMPGMTFKPTVLVFDPPREFRWLGHLFFPGLFDGEHIFELVDNMDGSTTFRQSEKFSGILVPFFANTLDTRTRNWFEEFNEKLKKLVEGRPGIKK